MTLASEKLRAEYGWARHPDHCLDDWKHEVANDDTRLSYWEWVACAIEMAKGNEP